MASTKRNDFQRAEDLKIEIDMLQHGHSLVEIAGHISGIRPYSISQQQVSADVSKLRLSAIAAMNEHASVTIEKELQEIEKVIEKAWEGINADRELVMTKEICTTSKTGETQEKTKEQWVNLTLPVQLLKTVLDAIARRSTLLGVDAHLKYLDINAAIESLTRLGYEVSSPDTSDGEEVN
jgi:hypothetical protein